MTEEKKEEETEKKEGEEEEKEEEEKKQQQQENSITGIKENPGSLSGFFLVAQTTIHNSRKYG